MRLRPTLPLLALTLLLAACGSDGDGLLAGPDAPATTSPEVPPPAASATGRPSSDPLLPDPTLPPKGASVTVSGTVTDGVEAGCLLLESGGTSYLLLGAPAEAKAGQQAEATGVLSPGTLSTCQQGVALQVDTYTFRTAG